MDVIKLPASVTKADLRRVGDWLSARCASFPIGELNWRKQFPYAPQVQGRIGYNKEALFLQFDVREKECRIVETRDNGPIWEDSCVEFFVQPEANGGYYNFEFNAAGVLLLAYGKDRHSRVYASEEVLLSIERHSCFLPTPDREGDCHWVLTARIPYAAFFNHLFSPDTTNCIKANFYKCGAKTRTPHFLSWHPVKTELPDFHRPEYFGTIIFR